MEQTVKQIIPHVQGNMLRLGIPLTLETITMSNGEIQKSDTEFYPTGKVKVVFSKNTGAKYEVIATTEGNIAFVEDNGNILAGTYDLTVLCQDDQGHHMRFKQDGVVKVYDLTREAGIPEGVEFSSETHWLNGAVFIAYGSGSGGGTGTEVDPVFSASPAAGITNEDIARWNTAPVDQVARQQIGNLQAALDAITSGDTTSAIKMFNEVIAFLENVEDTDTLQSIIAGLSTAIAAKYTKPGPGIPAIDLAPSVQTLLTLAGTAVQPSALNGYVTTSTLEGYYTKSQVDNLIPDISGKADKSEMSVSGSGDTVTITLKQGTSATVLTQHQSLSGYVRSSSLATVATSGDYNDLDNKPTFDSTPTANSDHPVTSGGVYNALANKANIFNMSTVTTSGNVVLELQPGMFYQIATPVDSLALTLAAARNGMAIYAGKFTTSANWGGDGLSIPSSVSEGTNNPEIEAGKTYEFNIMDNVLLLMEV